MQRTFETLRISIGAIVADPRHGPVCPPCTYLVLGRRDQEIFGQAHSSLATQEDTLLKRWELVQTSDGRLRGGGLSATHRAR